MASEDKDYKDFCKKSETIREFILRLVIKRNKGKPLTKLLNKMKAKRKINRRIYELQIEMERYWLSFFTKPKKSRRMQGIKKFITTGCRKKNMG